MCTNYDMNRHGMTISDIVTLLKSVNGRMAIHRKLWHLWYTTVQKEKEMNMKENMSKERIIKIILMLVMTVLLVFICVGCGAGHSVESGETSGSGRNEIFKAVLLGNSPFVYCSGGNAETMVITDVPALFDADDPLMKIFEFAVVDLNGDGEDETIFL